MFILSHKKVGCKYLEDPDYGKVEHGGTHPGAKATYSCDYGYKLVGNRVRRCQKNGYWSGRDPKCINSKLEEFYKVQVSNLNHEILLSISLYTKKVAVMICKIQTMAKWIMMELVLEP